MAFIPIDAKADIQGSKKGKLTPAQHAQLNAWCLSKKTGILDCLGKCEYDETKTSLVPSNDKKVTVFFKKGYIVICGRLIECEEGTSFDLTVPVIGNETGYIIAKYNLSSSKEEEFEIIQKKSTENLIQQDLNENVLGTYELVLYEYEATPSKVLLTRNIEYVRSIENYSEHFITNRLTIKDTSDESRVPSAYLEIGDDVVINDIDEQGIMSMRPNKHEEADKTGIQYYVNGKAGRLFWNGQNFVIQGGSIYASDDTSKGTIEERLTKLGFKEGSVTLSGGTATVNTVTRQGNYVIGTVAINRIISGLGNTFFTLPVNFRPKTAFTTKIYVEEYDSSEVSYYNTVHDVTFNTNGTVVNSSGNVIGNRIVRYQLNFGFEAPPIN